MWTRLRYDAGLDLSGAHAQKGENGLSDNNNSSINLPLISAIVGVATIGGFMFGYDSGVSMEHRTDLKPRFI
jgi:hypothetical protein